MNVRLKTAAVIYIKYLYKNIAVIYKISAQNKCFYYRYCIMYNAMKEGDI